MVDMKLNSEVLALVEQMQTWRRDIHKHPEPAYEEKRTSGLIADHLDQLGIEVVTGLGETGVVGRLQGEEPGLALAMRADMDALLISEKNSFAHASVHPGCMHACGHDGHVAMLMGAASCLAKRPDFKGEAIFVFQPAEESRGGAPRMVKDGLFEQFRIDEVYGIHNWPDWPLGVFGVRSGHLMAATEFFRIEICAKGCHGAMPHLGIDPIPLAAQIVSALQTVVSRNIAPTDSAVISVTEIKGGETWNAIADEVFLRGTIRYFDEHVRQIIHERVEQLVVSMAEAFGAQAKVEFSSGYPPLINSTQQALVAANAARRCVEVDQVKVDFPPTMGAEDFSYFLKEKPGCFVWLGVSSSPMQQGLHSPYFDFNDAALPYGASFWVELMRNRNHL
jgi:hippurate hydrolase